MEWQVGMNKKACWEDGESEREREMDENLKSPKAFTFLAYELDKNG